MTMQQANTILEQLGGNKFIAMTGAKDFTRGDFALAFRLPRNPGKISAVRIRLAGDDTYGVEFFGKSGIVAVDHIYCNQLREVFEAKTFLRTSL